MWALRILNSKGNGAIHDLKMGKNLIGRASTCDIPIKATGISKEHAEIHVYKDKILLVDLRSSNGTYLNGVRVQNGMVRIGDKIGIHDLIMDIVPATTRLDAPRASASQAMTPYYGGGAAPVLTPQEYQPQQPGPHLQAVYQNHNDQPPQAAPAGFSRPGFVAQAEEYVERVALPGVYKLAELLEFRMVLASFLVLFVFSVTLLSMIPMVQITRSSIARESMRRAASLARTLAQVNQKALLEGNFTALSTHSVDTEDGIKRALIVQQSDGVIVAPSSQAGNSPDLPFVNAARRDTKPMVQEINSSTIGASFPIGMYDPNTGEPIVKAHAIILYDVSSLEFDNGRVLSLFFQTLIIAALLGIAVFFFMYKLIERPIVHLNAELDKAMREKTDNIESAMMFPALQALIGNVNSLLTRSLEGGGGGMTYVNKDGEAANLLHWVGVPAVAVRSDGTIIACNPGFEQLARNTSDGMAHQRIDAIGDQALQQNMDHLLNKAKENPVAVHNDQLEFGGQLFTLNCQAFTSNESVDYYVVTVSPVAGGSE